MFAVKIGFGSKVAESFIRTKRHAYGSCDILHVMAIRIVECRKRALHEPKGAGSGENRSWPLSLLLTEGWVPPRLKHGHFALLLGVVTAKHIHVEEAIVIRMDHVLIKLACAAMSFISISFVETSSITVKLRPSP